MQETPPNAHFDFVLDLFIPTADNFENNEIVLRCDSKTK